MTIAEIQNLAADAQSTEAANQSEAQRLAEAVNTIIDLCGPTIRRTHRQWKINNAHDHPTYSPRGIHFAGGKSRIGRGGHTDGYDYFLGGHSYLITADAQVVTIRWDGLETKFAGCAGWEDRLTGDCSIESLAEHLEYAPESAQEIIDALILAAQGDLRAAKGRQAKLAQAISTLRPPIQTLI